MLTLYYRPGTCALASRLALAEAGLAHEAVDVSGQLERLARVNPRGKVPVLDTGQGLLTESVAILGFISDCAPQARLMPQDPLARARCLSTLAWFASTVHIDYRRFRKPQVFSGEASAHADISARGGADFGRDLDELDAMLAGGPWVQGTDFTLADLYALVFVEWSITSGFHEARRNHLQRWLPQVLARPAVRQVLTSSANPLLQFLG